MTESLKTEGRVTYSSEDLNAIKDFKSQSSISIAGFEPISALTNKSIIGENYYGDVGTVGSRPANDRELMAKVNEIVDRMNALTELVTKHIIGR